MYEEFFQFYLSIKFRTPAELIINRLTVSVGVLFAIGTIVHYKTLNEFKVPKHWIENIKAKCGGEIADNFEPEQDNFEKLYIGLGVLYVYIGCIIE